MYLMCIFYFISQAIIKTSLMFLRNNVKKVGLFLQSAITTLEKPSTATQTEKRTKPLKAMP